jgi:hypothetical protein
MRIVLYAEEAGEAVGSITQLPPVGEPLTDDMLGAAHVLVRRAVVELAGLDVHEVRFDAPKRTRGRLARGSDLRHPARLRELLTWVSPAQRPDAAVVLIDADGDRQLANRLQLTLKAQVSPVIGVPVQEFEAWLAADESALATIVAHTGDAAPWPADPESLAPGEAKQMLGSRLEKQSGGEQGRLLRRSIAERCALDKVRFRCRSFAAFYAELQRIIAQPSRK